MLEIIIELVLYFFMKGDNFKKLKKKDKIEFSALQCRGNVKRP